MKTNYDSYKWLLNINSLKFDDKSVLLVGAGWMARQYAIALSKMKIKDVTIVSQSEEKAIQLGNEFNFQSMGGGIEKNIHGLKKMDLVIIATPVNLLLHAADHAVQSGQDNIMIEKPGSFHYKELISFSDKLQNQNVKVAYNRLFYTNFHKLKELVRKEGGITSCRYTITERVHTFDFEKADAETYSRCGIGNSLHVISMVHELIGMPKEISAYQYGKFEWHPSGAIFVGSGITENNIPFSYHADWNSSGGWGIEVMTKENAYRLIPLEDLFVCPKGKSDWKQIPFKTAFPDVKTGVAEEIAIMLNLENKKNEMISLQRAASFNKVAEKIFGYDS